MSRGISLVVSADEFHEPLHPPLLKDPHERGTDSLLSGRKQLKSDLHFVRWDLCNPAVAVDITSSNLLEVQITCDISMLLINALLRL